MFWQIYQKLMLSGFLNSGNLCLIHHLKKFWPHTASTASVKKSAIYQWKIGFLAIHSTKNDQYWLFWCQWWSDNQDQTFSWENWPLEAVEAAEAAKAAEVHEDEEVSNAWKITTEDFRGFQILEFNNLRTLFCCFEKKIFWQNHQNLCWISAPFLSEAVEAVCEVKNFSNDNSGINFHYSGSHWASVFGRFVKASGQARSLLCINS